MGSIENALYVLIGIGLALMIAGAIVMRLQKKKP
jgi:LPXTG-motif cell wall-anchored protein